MGSEAASVATERVTATWQLSRLPSWPQYCRATPTESLPFFGRPVSSTIQARTGPRSSIAGSAWARTAPSRAGVVPGSLSDEVVQGLVRRAHAARVEARRHRLHALALARQQQAGGVGPQRPAPV